MPIVEEIDQSVIENRKGRFEVSYDLLHSNDAALNELFSNVKVIDAINDDLYEKTTYFAYSDLFEPLPAREEVPEYLITVHKDEAGGLKLTADRLFDNSPILDDENFDSYDDEEFVQELIL